jgi:ribosomal protein S18 acetylase RimI-like enzyme
MRFAERIAPQYGVASLTLSVLLHNTPAIALYSKLGFRERAHAGGLTGATNSDCYMSMSKNLET